MLSGETIDAKNSRQKQSAVETSLPAEGSMSREPFCYAWTTRDGMRIVTPLHPGTPSERRKRRGYRAFQDRPCGTCGHLWRSHGNTSCDRDYRNEPRCACTYATWTENE